ncbi:MAG: hypothetical protein FJX74_23085 [Armatimonadetes bacterium]|nr:hypothetical protein [Armatimonadota bacterium]
MGEGGCGLGLLKGDRDKIMPKHVADQLDFLREAFAETNEGHVFDYMAAQRGMWARLSRPAEALDELVPDNPTLMQLKRRLGWDKTPVVYPDPPNPGGAPEWALWQRECMIGAQRILHWLIDNRQVSNGEFGGVWGDDTDLVESWMGVWLASDDDDKIKNALRLLADGVWEYCLVEGVSASIRDALRSQGTARRRRGNHGIHGTHGRGRRGDGAVEASPPAPLLKGEGRTATAATPGPPRARPAGGTPCGPRYRQQPRRVCSPIDALMPCQP